MKNHAIDSELLRAGRHVIDFFKGTHTQKEKADFLREEYGTSGHSPFESDYFVSSNAKGINFWRSDDYEGSTVSWVKAADRLDELILADARGMRDTEVENVE